VARYENEPLEDRYFRYIQQARYDLEGTVDGVVVFAFEVTGQVLARQAVEQSERQLQLLNQELAAANEELRAANEEIQASNEELADANRQLSRINSDLDNFVYTASHDLKAPILNVEGLLRAMEKQLSREISSNQTIQQIYQLLYGSVARFKATISDLTEVARISKESSEDVAAITFEEVLGEVVKDLEHQVQEAATKLEIMLNCEPLPFSRKNLKSVLYNLISNAVKYRSPDREPWVRVSCHTQEHYHLLCVEDNGLGIDMRQEEKIFALFKRLHVHVEGTGIGLYIVKKIVENAGGKIEVESQVGVGSTFRVYFRR
jgi:signal transduction histidine kinase